ncbi:hypothetical protein XarbCFBP8149_14870 [Xanthomonas arboricola]|nr:hypothetical protein XarbCFBP8149_14870 [Xanthomonas arboricola]
MPHGAGAIAARAHRHPRNGIDNGTGAPVMPRARPQSYALRMHLEKPASTSVDCSAIATARRWRIDYLRIITALLTAQVVIALASPHPPIALTRRRLA